jgi:hypothetical protein
MSSNSGSKFAHYLQIAASIATIVAACIAAIALIPAFGQWLDARQPPAHIEVPTVMGASTPTDLPLISEVTPEIQTLTPTRTPTLTGTPTPTLTPAPTVTPIRTPTPSPSPNPNAPPLEAQLGDEWLRSVDKMAMVYVPPPDAPFELSSGVMAPLEEYWIDKHPVTNAQYQLCVDDGVCRPSAWADDTDFNGDDYPVVGITWFGAMDYVGWLNEALPGDADWLYVLPDEAMWEYTAVGETGWIYPWGNEDASCELANTAGCVGRTSPVGSYPDGASWVGALDMAGNVWEWTDSWWDEDEVGRVFRGGSWLLNTDYARAAYRDRVSPDNFGGRYGFRVVLVRRSPISS